MSQHVMTYIVCTQVRTSMTSVLSHIRSCTTATQDSSDVLQKQRKNQRVYTNIKIMRKCRKINNIFVCFIQLLQGIANLWKYLCSFQKFPFRSFLVNLQDFITYKDSLDYKT